MLMIRPYQESDAETLWSLFYHTVRTINRRDYTQAQVEAWAPAAMSMDVWRTTLQKKATYVAEQDGKILAYAVLQSDGLIDHFFCHHQHQRQGLGRTLMTYLETEASRKKIDTLYAAVSITAEPFFTQSGFEVIKEQIVTRRGQTLRNIVMKKTATST
ncbi:MULTISPECIES: GNAT family N-acetyltransferase [unclassified Vibrio]|uniref:N-acetyltransferase family protein n=1 Tax=Vibrio sp. HB236076 TaxID=3232307 RepID=A0AB39HHV4_9VIBR|nr:GNAT family N-acetyltransferase [Vibrio sp. HB161653]MDP5254699.1 GNAT family N-acetyltransferase [Vibrio sp. HB161653]